MWNFRAVLMFLVVGVDLWEWEGQPLVASQNVHSPIHCSHYQRQEKWWKNSPRVGLLITRGRKKKCARVLALGTKANFQTKIKWRVELIMLVIQGEGAFCCRERKLCWLAVSCLPSYAEWIQTIIPSFSALDKADLGQPASGFWKSVFKGDIVGFPWWSNG